MVMKFIRKKENHFIFAIYFSKICFKVIVDTVEDIQYRYMKERNPLKWSTFGRVSYWKNC